MEFAHDSDDVVSSAEPEMIPVNQYVHLHVSANDVINSLDRFNTRAHPKLAGVNEIIEECKSFCITTFSIHAFSKRVNGGMFHSPQYAQYA